MNSILRAQQREQTWPFSSSGGGGSSDYELAIPIAPPPIPMSPHHRTNLRRQRSFVEGQHAIDIIPTFENPCRPCRSPRMRSKSTCFSKFRTLSPYLSIACFIAILVWEVCSLHAEVYKLRVNESQSHHRQSTGSGSYLRKISNDRSRKDYNPYDKFNDGTTTHRTVTTSTPIPPSTLSLDNHQALDGEEYEESGDGYQILDEPSEELGMIRDSELDGTLDSIGESDQRINKSRIKADEGLLDSRIALSDSGSKTSGGGGEVGNMATGSINGKKSAVEEQLAELLATRELLKSSRRKPTNSIPLSQMENPFPKPPLNPAPS